MNKWEYEGHIREVMPIFENPKVYFNLIHVLMLINGREFRHHLINLLNKLTGYDTWGRS